MSFCLSKSVSIKIAIKTVGNVYLYTQYTYILLVSVCVCVIKPVFMTLLFFIHLLLLFLCTTFFFSLNHRMKPLFFNEILHDKHQLNAIKLWIRFFYMLKNAIQHWINDSLNNKHNNRYAQTHSNLRYTCSTNKVYIIKQKVRIYNLNERNICFWWSI